jgi:hypothetical protein
MSTSDAATRRSRFLQVAFFRPFRANKEKKPPI